MKRLEHFRQSLSAHKKAWIGGLVLLHAVVYLILLLTQRSMLAGTLLLLWLDLMIYSAIDLKRRALLLSFGIAFFTFLMGRELLEALFSYQPEEFQSHTLLHTRIVLIVSLGTIFAVYVLLEQLTRRVPSPQIRQAPEARILRIRLLAKWLFYCAVLCAVAYALITIFMILKWGYYYSYTREYVDMIKGNLILYGLSKMEELMPVVLAIYFATMPGKRECTIAGGIYGVYLALSLGSGQRATIVLGVLWLFIYWIYRHAKAPSEGWISRRMVAAVLILTPFALVFFALFNYWRAGDAASSGGLLEGIRSFFYQQGVSVNVIKRAYDYQWALPQDKYYSCGFLFSGTFARVLGFQAFAGNSLLHATQGHSLSHALSYVLMPEEYLAGRGTGTCYIAELYHDFGMTGVVAGNVVLGCLLFACGRFRAGTPLRTSLKLAIIPNLLWVPRGMFTDFMVTISRPTTLIVLVLIFGGEPILKWLQQRLRRSF